METEMHLILKEVTEIQSFVNIALYVTKANKDTSQMCL